MIIPTLSLIIFLISSASIGNGETQNDTKTFQHDLFYEDKALPRKALNLYYDLPPLKHLNLTINFFEKPMIEDKLHKLMNLYFSDNPLFDNDDDLEESWRLYIFEKIHKSMEIPISLKNDVSLLSRSLIQELIEFLKKIFINLENDKNFWYPSLDDYFGKIKWKKNGKIDEVNTYLNIFNGRESATKRVDNKFMFLQACKYCLEEHINITWQELPLNIQEYIVKNVLNGKYYDVAKSELLSHQDLEMRHLLFYWRWKLGTSGSMVLRLNDSQLIKDDFELVSVTGNTIPNSINKTQIEAVQYLLETIENNDSKIKTIQQETINLLSKTNRKDYDDMLIFLMRQINGTEISNIFTSHRLEILDVLIESWHGRYLFMNFFDTTYYSMEEEIFRNLLTHIIKIVCEEYNLLRIKNHTNFWLLSNFLGKYDYILDKGAIPTCWSLSGIPRREQLIAIAFIASNPKIRKLNPSEDQTAIDRAFRYFGPTFLINKKYEVLSDYLNYMLSNEKKTEFIKILGIEKTYIDLLRDTDDSKLSPLFDFYDWLNAIGETTITTKIINDSLSSNKILQEKHDAVYFAYTLQV